MVAKEKTNTPRRGRLFSKTLRPEPLFANTPRRQSTGTVVRNMPRVKEE